MSAPTPGPWQAKGGAVLAAGGEPVAVVAAKAYPEIGEVGRANARLIAAAPELYEALVMMVDRWEPDSAGADRRMWEAARAAIAKAQGR